ncbi:Bridging integrator 3 [Ophiophagus hannah]|uniref:Bridging integrator 3 n=1 Tax=Ophiophagus hannah TaxID=8665 RepID=V8PHY5_OPHHA|nr:Bridging integrator 3 [Ophiophagus hannah]
MKKSTDADLDPKFLEMVMALDTAMKRMDSFNQEKVSFALDTFLRRKEKFSKFDILNCEEVV